MLAAPTAAAAAGALVHPLMVGAASGDLEEQVARLPERQEDAHHAASDDDEEAKNDVEAEIAQAAAAEAYSPYYHCPAKGYTSTSSQASVFANICIHGHSVISYCFVRER